MKTEEIQKAATDLYWLAFLLTGRRDASIDIAADVAGGDSDSNLFFDGWMRDWQRRLVIGKALTAVHDELAASARQTETMPVSTSGIPRKWSPGPDTTKSDLERALLAIDLFPRAALLLLVFEGVRIADAATLLDARPELLRKAQAIGLHELTANLAAMKGSTDSPSPQNKPRMKRLAPKKFIQSLRIVTVCR